jgi:YgiT-type zinc finger domain-containing protein
MECANEQCPGRYVPRELAYTLKYDGEVIVIDRVPAQVCSVCGDVLVEPETVRRIQELLASPTTPVRTVALLEYA